MKKFTPILPVFLLAFLFSPAFGATVHPFGDIGAGKPHTIGQLGDNIGDSSPTGSSSGGGSIFQATVLAPEQMAKGKDAKKSGKKKSGKSWKEKKKSGKSLKEYRKGKK